ncbi:Uncharacterised protein [Mycobacteroides abscessus subsp. abscessus]|nr:Uncharacterised protein [Mycobacteroides abscessus subsp. abscessus]
MYLAPVLGDQWIEPLEKVWYAPPFFSPPRSLPVGSPIVWTTSPLNAPRMAPLTW